VWTEWCKPLFDQLLSLGQALAYLADEGFSGEAWLVCCGMAVAVRLLIERIESRAGLKETA